MDVTDPLPLIHFVSVDSPFLNEKVCQAFDLGRVTFQDFDGAAITCVPNLEGVVLRQPFQKFLDLSMAIGNGDRVTAALENSSRSLSGAVKRYPVDE